MKAALFRFAPMVPVVDLCHDVPAFDIEAAAHLLAAFAPAFPKTATFVGVVDPGVGTAARQPAMIACDGVWFVGPDNGLFDVVAARGKSVRWRHVTWRPAALSASFHGRDLFAPVAARLARDDKVEGEDLPVPERVARAGGDLARVIYIDRYGNAMTGVRAVNLGRERGIAVGGRRLAFAETFGRAPAGEPFWYENANGLVEIALNRGRAAESLGLVVGTAVRAV
jgi:S-adenosylmethionine hydrolase